MKSAFGYFGLVSMAVSASTTTAASITARPSLGVASERMASAAFATTTTGPINVTVGSRHLQATCSSDAVTLSVAVNSDPSSSASSLDAFAGCYQDTGLIASGLPYYTPSGLDLPYAFIAGLELNITSSDSPSTFVRWVLADYESDTLLCASNEPADSIHPADSTWLCSDEDSGNEVVSAVCGGDCEDSEPGETTCSSETVLVTSSAFPSLEGCYQPTEEESEGRAMYSMTGQVVEGEPLMLVSTSANSIGPETLIWNLGLVVGSTINRSCVSAPTNNIGHPSDASWSCDINGDLDIRSFPSETADTPGLFEVTCGSVATSCDASSPSSSTGTANPRGITSSGSDTPESEDDIAAPVIDSESASEDSEDSESAKGGASTSTGGGVRLAAAPTLRLVSGFVGLVLATALGAYGAL